MTYQYVNAYDFVQVHNHVSYAHTFSAKLHGPSRDNFNNVIVAIFAGFET